MKGQCRSNSQILIAESPVWRKRGMIEIASLKMMQGNRGNHQDSYEGEVEMHKHILVPTDGSELSAAAVEKALTFARELSAKVTILTVALPFHAASIDSHQLLSTREGHEQQVREQTNKILAEAARMADKLQVSYETMQIQDDHPHQAIIRAAEQKGCDLIAMASHGRRGVSAIVLGSETLKVLTHSKIPVLVYR